MKSWTLGSWVKLRDKKKVTVALWGGRPPGSEIPDLLGTPGTYRRRASSLYDNEDSISISNGYCVPDSNDKKRLSDSISSGNGFLFDVKESDKESIVESSANEDITLEKNKVETKDKEKPDDLLCGEDVVFDAEEDKIPLEDPIPYNEIYDDSNLEDENIPVEKNKTVGETAELVSVSSKRLSSSDDGKCTSEENNYCHSQYNYDKNAQKDPKQNYYRDKFKVPPSENFRHKFSNISFSKKNSLKSKQNSLRTTKIPQRCAMSLERTPPVGGEKSDEEDEVSRIRDVWDELGNTLNRTRCYRKRAYALHGNQRPWSLGAVSMSMDLFVIFYWVLFSVSHTLVHTSLIWQLKLLGTN